MEELPSLTFEQRQLLIRRAIELDEPVLSEAEEALVDTRLAGHNENPSSSIPLEQLKEKLLGRRKQS